MNFNEYSLNMYSIIFLRITKYSVVENLNATYMQYRGNTSWNSKAEAPVGDPETTNSMGNNVYLS